MTRPAFIELGELRVPILHEDRSVLALDKPSGWMCAPDSWSRTGRNLQLAILSSIGARDFWARSRNIRYLRFIHRLDAETSGVLLMARSQGALNSISDLFRGRLMEKHYLAVVEGIPKQTQWSCNLPLGPDPNHRGVHKLNAPDSKPAETHFRVLEKAKGRALIEARPVTGRTHQIRLHLKAAGLPIVGDPAYGPPQSVKSGNRPAMGLRAVYLAYRDPFTRRPVEIHAPAVEFLEHFGFAAKHEEAKLQTSPGLQDVQQK